MTKTPPTIEGGQGWDQSSTCRAVEEMGRSAGKAYGLAEAAARTMAQMLRRQAEQKFGGADASGAATLDGLAQAFACRQLEDLAERLLTAPTWSDWLAPVIVPPPAPGFPDYARDLEIDLEPASPSIDSYLKARMFSGEDVLIHLRLQKWYQPDLDRILFDSSRMLEREHGTQVIVAVFLMWPSADGPGITGQFVERDARGQPQRTFTYHMKRAWELEPEEAMQGPGTMLLAPLTRGARERLPEIVQMLKDGLKRHAPDDKTLQMVWEAVYWSMGVVCAADEADRLLADVLPLIQSSPNYQSAKGHAFLTAFSQAQRDGPTEAARNLVLRQATCRFGPLEGAAEALAAVNTMEELGTLARRVLTATDWPSLLKGS